MFPFLLELDGVGKFSKILTQAELIKSKSGGGMDHHDVLGLTEIFLSLPICNIFL